MVPSSLEEGWHAREVCVMVGGGAQGTVSNIPVVMGRYIGDWG